MLRDIQKTAAKETTRVVVSEKFSRVRLRDKRQGSSSWFCCQDYIWFSLANNSVKDFFRTLCQRKDSVLLLWSVILKEVIMLVLKLYSDCQIVVGVETRSPSLRYLFTVTN